MKIGFHLTPFWSPTDRGATRIIDEAITVVAAASRMGFGWVSIGQHWISHPTVWPQPFPILARLAPDTGTMRLKTSVLLLPIVNAVETAENVATLDHICHGRLDVGVGIGYRETELLPNVWGVNILPKQAFEEYVLMQIKFKSLYRAVFENRLVQNFIEELRSRLARSASRRK